MRMMDFGKYLVVALALIFFSTFSALGQETDVSVRVEANETVQSVNIQSLMANNRRGTNLFRLFLSNNSSERIDDLYLEIIISSERVGRIIRLAQVNNQPFSLKPGQQIYATNNSLREGVLGVEEAIQFEGNFTSEGQQFVNSLQGDTELPAGRYTVEINVYQGAGLQSQITSDLADFGANIVENTGDFYLLSPGDIVGNNSAIANPYPHFQWQGMSGRSYRLIVVEANDGESPQSLLESAASTAPTRENGSPTGGSLVDFEMLDVVLSHSNFQYPSSGVQDLKPGEAYYWRVIGRLETSSGQETTESEIWSFSLTDNRDRLTGSVMQSQELSRVLEILLGDQYETLNQQDYSFQSLKVEEQELQGGQAVQKLIELSERVEEGEVSIIIENE